MVKKIHSQAVTFWLWRLYMEYVVDRHPKRYSPMSMVGRGMLEGYKCERCGISGFHANINLKKEPIICPKCKSPYWNIPKK
jgi:hypothetical protein